jgi:hypothetical protein
MRDLSDDDIDVLVEAYWSLFYADTPLSTVELWHEVRRTRHVSYGRLRRIMKTALRLGYDIKEKQQMGGYGRRDYYLGPDTRKEFEAIAAGKA